MKIIRKQALTERTSKRTPLFFGMARLFSPCIHSSILSLMFYIRQIPIHKSVCHDKCVSSWNINFAINFHMNCIHFYQYFSFFFSLTRWCCCCVRLLHSTVSIHWRQELIGDEAVLHATVISSWYTWFSRHIETLLGCVLKYDIMPCECNGSSLVFCSYKLNLFPIILSTDGVDFFFVSVISRSIYSDDGYIYTFSDEGFVFLALISSHNIWCKCQQSKSFTNKVYFISISIISQSI